MKLIDKLRDILYDSVDYIFMIFIIVIVVGVIGWRLDVLFAKDAFESQTPGQIVVDNSSREDDEPSDIEDEPSDSVDPEQDPSGEENPVEEPQEQPQQPDQPSSPVVVKVEIPVGSMPGKIGLLLEEKGVVSSSREFIAKAVELGLDTKLKSGSYNIQLGLPTEDVVRLLTK